MAKIIAMVGQKGGTGKTTTAIALAVEWVVRRRSVLLVDLDTQGVGAHVGGLGGRARREHVPPSPPSALNCGDSSRRTCRAATWSSSIAPSHGERQRAAMMAADVALLPAGPDATECGGSPRRPTS